MLERGQVQDPEQQECRIDQREAQPSQTNQLQAAALLEEAAPLLVEALVFQMWLALLELGLLGCTSPQTWQPLPQENVARIQESPHHHMCSGASWKQRSLGWLVRLN